MSESRGKHTPKILVTGGSGFIGGYVLRHLRARGYTVINFDLAEDPDNNDSFIKASILDVDAVQKAVDQSDLVFHFAGFANINLVKQNPRSCIELNVMGTTNFLEAIRKKGAGSLVLASSVYVHNKNGYFYTTSKLASEQICENYRDQYGISVAMLRLGTVYGERSRHEDVVSIFVRRAIQGQTLSIHGSGGQVRHFIHGEDVAAACARLVTVPDINCTFILSSRRGTSISALAAIVAQYVPSVEIETCVNRGREDDYKGDMGDGSMLENTYQALQWQPLIDIDEGVKRLLRHFRGGVH